MKKILLILMLPLLCNLAFGQNKADADKLVNEGVGYHDKGDYDGAIARYDKALGLDKDNLFALAEKAMSLLSLQKYDEAITCCQQVIAAHPGDKDLKTVYVTYGNASDGLKKTDNSIQIYDEGIKLFPDFYQLYFNKGISLTSVKKFDEAMLCFQQSAMLNPEHASSHNAIARISDINNKRIPALLAYCRFLSIEPQSNRAKENFSGLQTIMKGNVEQTGKNAITININMDSLGDTTEAGKPKENNFTSVDMILALSAASDFDKKNKKKPEVELFIEKLETVCSVLSETKNDNSGFFWEYYVPYFTEMKDKNLIETFGYIAYASSGAPEVTKWLKGHKTETDAFFDWSDSFEWKTN